MIKKIIVLFVLFFSFFSLNNSLIFANNTDSTNSVECKRDSNGICGTEFTINMNEISPQGTGNPDLKGTDSQKTINNSLGNIIRKLMVVLTMIALFIMTIGAGYIVMYHGQDEYLTKGKNIFTAGVWALVVALSSYYLVSLLTYILYK